MLFDATVYGKEVELDYGPYMDEAAINYAVRCLIQDGVNEFIADLNGINNESVGNLAAMLCGGRSDFFNDIIKNRDVVKDEAMQMAIDCYKGSCDES